MTSFFGHFKDNLVCDWKKQVLITESFCKSDFLQTQQCTLGFLLVIDRNVYEMTEKNLSFPSECMKI